MSQPTTPNWGTPLTPPATPQAFAARADDSLDALLSCHSGATAPGYAVAGTLWLDTSTAPPMIKYYNGSTWVAPPFALPPTSGTGLAPLLASALQTLTNAQRIQARDNIRANKKLARTITSASTLADRTLKADDCGQVILFSGTTDFTVLIDAASTLGNGWNVRLKSIGRALVTIDPNGAEAIDGVASGTLPVAFRQEIDLICTGTDFQSLGANRTTRIEKFDLANIAQHDLLLPAGYRTFELVTSYNGVGAARDLRARLSTDGGATFAAGATDYAYSFFGLTTGNAVQTLAATNLDSMLIVSSGDSTSGPYNAAKTIINNPRDASTLTMLRSDSAANRSGLAPVFSQITTNYPNSGAVAHNAIRLFGQGGNINLKGELYGVP